MNYSYFGYDKWIVSGCKTIQEMIERYESHIQHLKDMQVDGLELANEADAHWYIYTDNKELAEKYGFQEDFECEEECCDGCESCTECMDAECFCNHEGEEFEEGLSSESVE